MEIHHKRLGRCKLLLQFEGRKNQMALVTCKKTYDDNNSIVDTRGTYLHPSKPTIWMLWGSLEQDLSDAGITKMETPTGRPLRQSPATRKFMEATKYVDELTLRRIIK
jgi:hypothetical protein